LDFLAQICLGMSLVQCDVFQDARLCPVIARSLRSDDCSRVNVGLRVAIAGGQLNDFAYSLYVLAIVTRDAPIIGIGRLSAIALSVHL